MTIEEMKRHEWSVSWSGGKDSTATIILMHENNIPIKEIVYVRMMYDEEIPATLPVMTDFVDDAIKVFENWGYTVTVVKSVKTAKDLMCNKYKKSKYQDRNGNYYGITAFARRNCAFTGIKIKTIEILQSSEYTMLGYAADETSRIHRLTENKQSIMFTLGIKEIDTYDICRKYNLLSPLYDLGIKRDGCFFCPNAAKKERNYVKSNYPELLEEIKFSISMCDFDLESFIKSKSNNWVTDYYNNQISIDDIIKEGD